MFVHAWDFIVIIMYTVLLIPHAASMNQFMHGQWVHLLISVAAVFLDIHSGSQTAMRKEDIHCSDDNGRIILYYT